MKTSPEFMVELSVIYSHSGPSTMQKRPPPATPYEVSISDSYYRQQMS